MRAFSRLGMLVAVLILAACRQDESSIRPAALGASTGANPAQGQVQPAMCAPQGTEVRTTDGRVFSFLGRHPSDPESCRWNTQGVNRVTSFLHSLISSETETSPLYRVGLRPLFPLATGKSVTFTVQRSAGIWRNTYRVLGEQRLSVPAGTFDVWLVERIEEGMFGNTYRGENIFFIEKDTGLIVKVTSSVVRGQGGLGNWEALSVRRPN